MAYTNPCAISGGQWDGPSGCPIISPSRWQTDVLDNLCALALHNHSGSAGEGGITFVASSFPAIDNDAFSPFFPTASANWSLTNRTSNWLLLGVATTVTQGASISYDVYLRDGTYQLNFLSGCNSKAAIITCCISGASVGSVDLYDSVSSSNVSGSISFSITGAGERQLTFATDTKNDSSTGYEADINFIAIRRTGA